MSDRKITAGDVEYEPNQLKIAFISDRALITVAGDISLHSEAIVRTNEQVRGRSDTTPQNIASIYGHAIQSAKQRQAEAIYLAPIGLNTDTFLAQQREYSDGFIERITQQMQNYVGPDVESLVVAADGNNAQIIHVDPRGMTSNMNDLGFAAIGIGSWHARSKLMQSGYVNTAGFSKAITETFAAKRSAEIAPGVGKFTDAFVVFRNAIEPLRAEIYAKTMEIYDVKVRGRAEIEREAVDELQEYINQLAQQGVTPTVANPPEMANEEPTSKPTS